MNRNGMMNDIGAVYGCLWGKSRTRPSLNLRVAGRELQVIHDPALQRRPGQRPADRAEPEVLGPGVDEMGLALAPSPGDDAQRGHAERCGSGTMGGLLCQR